MVNADVATSALGWFGLGLSGGLLVPLLARGWTRWLLASVNPWWVGGSIAGLAAISVALLLNQAPASATHAAATPGSTTEPDAMTGDPAAAAGGSMDAATSALSARLAARGGSDADWTLLAQSYDFLGRGADAQLAREHKVSAQRSLQDAMASSARLLGSAMPATATAPAAAPGNSKVAALLTQAEEYRRKREFKQACDAFRAVIAAGGMTADAWADYADALASSTPSGGLSGEPAKAIDKALALDPQHAKALWLKASLAHEEHRYQDALATWRALLALMPPGSSDARIVEANIAEAARLASPKG